MPSSVVLAVIPALPLAPPLAWAGVTVVSSVGLRLAAPLSIRDLVDARVAAHAVVVRAILAAYR